MLAINCSGCCSLHSIAGLLSKYCILLSLHMSPYFSLYVSLLPQVIAYGKLSGSLSSNALQLAARDQINMGLGTASAVGLASEFVGLYHLQPTFRCRT